MTTITTKPDPNAWKKYTCIEAWGIMLASYWYYVEGEMHKAADEGAPLDALYHRADGTWALASELTPDHRFFQVLADMKMNKQRVAFKPTSLITHEGC